MIPKDSILRIARPTDRLKEISQMYAAGLGFELLAEFYDHNGFDGVILGHPHHPYHLEFTHHKGTVAGAAPTKDNLLVFYVAQPEDWKMCCSNMLKAGFKEVVSYNEYWDRAGYTFEDVDQYRVVIQNEVWSK